MLKDMLIPLSVSATPQTFRGDGVFGRLYKVEYNPGTILTGAGLVLTCEGFMSQPLLTQANAGTSKRAWYPRDLAHGVEDGVALTGTAGGDRVMPMLQGIPTLVITSGWSSGVALVGALKLYYYEEED